MNSIKTVVVVIILMAVGYGVYTSVNNNTITNPPPGVPKDGLGPVNIQLGAGSSSGQFPSRFGGPTLSGNAPVTTAPGTGMNVTTAIPGSPSNSSFGPPVTLPGSNGNSSLSCQNSSSCPVLPGAAAGGPSLKNPVTAAPPWSTTMPAAAPGGLGSERNPGAISGMPAASYANTGGSAAQAPVTPATASAMSASPGASTEVRKEFAAMMQSARQKIDNGDLRSAHLALSGLYNKPGFLPEENRQLTELLDQLAGTVIYSRRHALEQPYTIKQGDSIQQIAQMCNVPWQLLVKINRLRDPEHLQPGQQLKVLRGPFEAVVYVDQSELVLRLGGHYAGKFPITIGRDRPHMEGVYSVKAKSQGHTYVGRERTIDAGAPDNPLGRYWIGLEDQFGIHGPGQSQNPGRPEDRGYIALGARDIDDVYDILSVGSPVTIQNSGGKL